MIAQDVYGEDVLCGPVEVWVEDVIWPDRRWKVWATCVQAVAKKTVKSCCRRLEPVVTHVNFRM